jgi:RNA polymerase sigma-70 factor (ECF subfamily)
MRALVERAQRGDHGAFSQLARELGPELHRLAVAVIGLEGAADVTQDALVRAWRELPKLRDPDAFLPWARRIVVNRCRDVIRSRHGVRVLSLELATQPSSGSSSTELPIAPDPAPAIDRSADLDGAFRNLGHDQREIVALHYALGLPISEIAQTLQIPAGTVKSRLHSALTALRRTLAETADA